VSLVAVPKRNYQTFHSYKFSRSLLIHNYFLFKRCKLDLLISSGVKLLVTQEIKSPLKITYLWRSKCSWS